MLKEKLKTISFYTASESQLVIFKFINYYEANCMDHLINTHIWEHLKCINFPVELFRRKLNFPHLKLLISKPQKFYQKNFTEKLNLSITEGFIIYFCFITFVKF